MELRLINFRNRLLCKFVEIDEWRVLGGLRLEIGILGREINWLLAASKLCQMDSKRALFCKYGI